MFQEFTPFHPPPPLFIANHLHLARPPPGPSLCAILYASTALLSLWVVSANLLSLPPLSHQQSCPCIAAPSAIKGRLPFSTAWLDVSALDPLPLAPLHHPPLRNLPHSEKPGLAAVPAFADLRHRLLWKRIDNLHEITLTTC